MVRAERFRLRVEGVFNIAERGTAVLGPILSGAVSISDRLGVEGREVQATATIVAIDRALRTLEDGLPRAGVIVEAWTNAYVAEGDVLASVDPPQEAH